MDPYGEPPELMGIADIFSNVLEAIIPLIGIASFVMLIVGGITILSSSGNADGVEKGQKTITFAVGGIVLAIISWLVLKLIENITGAPVTQFKFGF